MAHHLTVKHHSYYNLSERINRFPQGAPPSDLHFEILQILFTEREAGLVSLHPVKPLTAAKAAGIWKMKEPDSRVILNDLADRGILVDGEYKNNVLYSLPPWKTQVY
jgi:hypothetical protein